jgi:hypothetical protein
MGDKKLPGIAAEDIGRCAYGIFKKGEVLINKEIFISGENLTVQQMAESFTKTLGQEVKYNPVPPETYRGFGFPGADDMGNMFQFKSEFEDYFSGIRKPEFARSLNPELKNFDQWLEENKNKIPLE